MQKLHTLLRSILLRHHKKTTIQAQYILTLPQPDVVDVEVDFPKEEADVYRHVKSTARLEYKKSYKRGFPG